MTRNRALLLSLLPAAAVVALMFLLRPSRDNITEANAARVQVGMSKAEVERILGGPPGNYSPPVCRYGLFGPKMPIWKTDDLMDMPPDAFAGRVDEWDGKAFRVEVLFDSEDRVYHVACVRVVKAPPERSRD
jgi:hypothetical protein